jgi:hypothetical protein
MLRANRNFPEFSLRPERPLATPAGLRSFHELTGAVAGQGNIRPPLTADVLSANWSKLHLTASTPVFTIPNAIINNGLGVPLVALGRDDGFFAVSDFAARFGWYAW